MTLSWCVGGRHKSKTKNKNVYEKVNPKTKKLFKILKGRCDICGRNKSQIFTKLMTKKKFLLETQVVNMGIDQPSQIQHGVI